MIRKELDPFLATAKLAKAGRAAEEQMAFYLKRFFEKDPGIHVLNGIRIERSGDAAQIDHLILHPYGFFIVESKSVQGKLQIKDDGQWIRWFNGNQSRGMASPITQAELQGRFIKTTLGIAAKSETIFERVPLDILVAISDAGIILWPKTGNPLPEVCKADQVEAKIKARVAALQEERRGQPLLGHEQIEKLVHFLIASHKPLRSDAKVEAAPLAYEAAATTTVTTPSIDVARIHDPVSVLACKHCGSPHIEIRYGHNYYAYCLDCTKNSPVILGTCGCGEPERVRKQAKEFFVDCKSCSTSKRLHVNP